MEEWEKNQNCLFENSALSVIMKRQYEVIRDRALENQQNTMEQI